MQTATSETEIKSRYLSICVHHYTLRSPCPKGQGKGSETEPLPEVPQHCQRIVRQVQYHRHCPVRATLRAADVLRITF